MPSSNGRSRKPRKVRRQEAEVRQAERDKRTPAQQIEVLNARLGIRVGAVKERARLRDAEWSKDS